MKKLFLLIVFFLFSVTVLQAQQSAGFSDPDDISSLLDYRLPDWGYSNFYLNFSFTDRKQYEDETQSEEKQSYSSTRVFLAPAYTLYQESEKRIVTLNSRLFVGIDRRERSSSNIENSYASEIQDANSHWSSDADLQVSLKEYVAPQLFLSLEEDVGLANRSAFQKRNQDGELTKRLKGYTRHFSSRTELGLGVGRIRNVTPVLRAIRLGERYRAVTEGDRLSRAEVMAAADEFTRYQAYQRRYDRPEKYFWQAMNKALNNALTRIDPFDIFYMTDVFNEAFGRRLEGWEMRGGLLFSYSNELSRAKEIQETSEAVVRSVNIKKSGGAFVSARWYRNFSLNHQLGLSFNADVLFQPDAQEQPERTIEIFGGINWIWNIANRLFLFSNLSNRYKNERFRINSTSLHSGLVYYLENRLAINVKTSLVHTFEGAGQLPADPHFDQRRLGLSFDAGLRYYFSRYLY